MAKRIIFKSKDDIWRKEHLGLKCNTVRDFSSKEKDDVRKKILDDYICGRWTPQKEQYYQKSIGYDFEVLLTSTKDSKES